MGHPVCVSVRWVTLWVRPPPFENMCVRSLGYIVGASPPLWKYVCPFVGLHCGCIPPSLKICVSVRWVTFWVRSPLCVSIQLLTLWVRPPLVCVLSLEDNLHWILACCLLRFAAFFPYDTWYPKLAIDCQKLFPFAPVMRLAIVKISIKACHKIFFLENKSLTIRWICSWLL